MNRFIEVEARFNRRNALVNIDYIYNIVKDDSGGCIISFGGENFIKVDDTYESLKAKIKEVTNG